MWPHFDAAVSPGGYAWWYLDAVSDDRRHALTLIAFIGSVFSPYYARARRRGPAQPLDHCALNVALYGPVRRWTMTERGQRLVERDAAALRIGPSRLARRGDEVVIDVDEISVPCACRVRGQVSITPLVRCARAWTLDDAARHRWQPLAPCARIEVDLQAPTLRWSGTGYHDSNHGAEPLEDAFSGWHWARTPLPGHRTVVTYDVTGRDGARRQLGIDIDADGAVREFAVPDPTGLPRTLWRVERRAHCGNLPPARVARTLEDTPFYARSLLASRVCGENTTTMHESLSLDRFRSRWVQMLLPFRMPRVTR
jgi:carotenoid 1,2-hydratase